MSRISVRIFLGFWLTLVAIIGVTVGLVVGLVSRSPVAGEPAAFVQGAALALAQGGRDGLRTWLAGPGQRLPYFFVYVLDDAGRDLLGRTLVEPVRRWPRLGSWPLPGAPGVTYTAGSPMPTLTGPDGARYSIVTLPPPWSPFRALARPQVMATVVAIALSLTALISAILALSLTRPIRILKRHTEEFRDGDFGHRIPAAALDRRDEIGDLGRSFSSMTTRIQELLTARERLLRDVSHELRSPLARMKMALALARQPGADPALQIARIETDTQRMDDIIGQILALSRLDAPELELDAVMLDLVELVDRIAVDAAFEAKAIGRTLVWDAPDRPVPVTANAHWLGSAIENAVRNAVRYGPPGKPVEIELKVATDRTSVHIRDHGAGVPETELARIFEPFYRTTVAQQREPGGEGLGLAITERVMRLHGGTAAARNAAGGGLLVELTIPSGASTAPAPLGR